jgi:UDP-N-acetylglucosamine 2-epimerase
LALVHALAERRKVVFVMHPRTMAATEKLDNGMHRLLTSLNVSLVGPLGYADFIAALNGAAAIITDR